MSVVTCRFADRNCRADTCAHWLVTTAEGDLSSVFRVDIHRKPAEFTHDAELTSTLVVAVATAYVIDQLWLDRG